MPLNFAGQPIPGLVFDPDIDPPAIQVVRTHYAGLKGETEINLGEGGRYIRFPVELCDASFRDAAAVTALLKKFDERIGATGDLKQTGNIVRTFKNCTFEGCKKLHEPIPDHAKTLISGVVSYHCRVLLVWYQLTTQDD